MLGENDTPVAIKWNVLRHLGYNNLMNREHPCKYKMQGIYRGSM